LLNDFSVYWHIGGVLLIAVLLSVFGQHTQPLGFLFHSAVTVNPNDLATTFAVGPWSIDSIMLYLPALRTLYSNGGLALAFVLGLLQAQWTYTGYDASAHVAEERIMAPFGYLHGAVLAPRREAPLQWPATRVGGRDASRRGSIAIVDFSVRGYPRRFSATCVPDDGSTFCANSYMCCAFRIMPEAGTPMVTLLFTSLVDSTALLHRAGDQQTQRIFGAHYRVLKEAVAADGDHPVKCVGDGLLVVFRSAAAAVRCAVALQQTARRPVDGERLAIRVGLNTGDAPRQETDYLGMPVLVARRLCEQAMRGQILCSTAVSGLLADGQIFTFRDCGVRALNGLAAPVATCEVVYEPDEHPARRDPRRLAYELGAAFAGRQLGELLPFAVAKCRELLGAEGVAVFLLDRQRNELYVAHAADEDPAVAARLLEVRFPADRGIAGSALCLGTALRIDDVAADPRFFGGVDDHTGLATRALLCAPFTSQCGVSGVIEVVNPCHAEVFNDDDLALLEALAASLANALDTVESDGHRTLNGGRGRGSTGVGHAAAGDVFRKDGDYWTLVFEGRTARLKDARGLHYIAHLLRHPGREIHARDLAALAGDCAPPSPGLSDGQLVTRVDLGNAGPLLDAHAKAAYKHRLDDLREEQEEAERFNDAGRVSRVHEEREFITHELAAAIGLGGRDRVAASEAERARLAVTKRIKAALAKISDVNPALAQHLTAAITTGYFCCYAPTVETLTSWVVG
jgi:class 3 adenylate cyclase